LADLLYSLLTHTRTITDEALWSPVDELLERVRASVSILKPADFAVALQQAREKLIDRLPLSATVGACSDVGQLREINEDSWTVLDLSDVYQSLGITVGVFGVADGVGGQDAGDVASRLTVEAINGYGDELRRVASLEQRPEAETWITGAARVANEAVFHERERVSSNMGCTLVLGLVVGRTTTFLNVGDSRAYRLNEQGIAQITTDHSLVQRLVEIGQLTPEQARTHPQKSVIYRVIGDSLRLDYDLFEETFEPGEAFLLCSDGLTDMVEDATIWQTWQAADSPQVACEALVALANEAGGYDNITVVIVAFHAV
jgi:protein phosphatase